MDRKSLVRRICFFSFSSLSFLFLDAKEDNFDSATSRRFIDVNLIRFLNEFSLDDRQTRV